jgi:lipid-A-disaccharide synthase-like uncharacterized protein
MILALTWEQFFTPLALFGFFAQFWFMLRFVVQWAASERRGRSFVPESFWWISLTGGLMLFIYATLREDPVFMAGQLLGVAIYVRNIVLIYQRKWRHTRRQAELQAATDADAGGAAPLLGDGAAPATTDDADAKQAEREEVRPLG